MINNEYSSFNSTKQPHHPGFTIGRKWHLSFTLVAILLSILSILFYSGQSIGLVLFLGSFNGLTGVYFVLFFCSLSFTIIFTILAIWFGYKKQITKSMLSIRWIKYMLIVGVFDAINGFLIVFSSHGSRVPPALSSILIQSIIPFTFIFSKFLLPKKYQWSHIISVGVVLIGITFSLIPTFKRMHDGTATTELKDGWYWPFVFIIGCVPAALMNIYQEKLQIKYTQQARENQEEITRFSVMYFQAVESTFQFGTIALCFALDLIPGFGTSKNIDSFWSAFSNGFKCFFNDRSLTGGRCNYAGGTGLLFIISYLGTYVTGTFLTDHVSANWLSILSSISPLLSTSFWFIFPAINKWAQVGAMDAWDIGFSLGALPIILIGMFFYRSGGTDRKAEEENHLQDEQPVELFW
jgi:drug/metabolite transporter (DMT)-like permease